MTGAMHGAAGRLAPEAPPSRQVALPPFVNDGGIQVVIGFTGLRLGNCHFEAAVAHDVQTLYTQPQTSLPKAGCSHVAFPIRALLHLPSGGAR